MNEQTVKHLLAQGNRQEAVRQLYEMVVEAAGRRDFTGAEALRQKLIAIDGMALTEIIGAAEVIDAAKSAAIDPAYNEQWHELRERLDEEENNTFYFALKDATLRPGLAFVEQGKLNERLFFIIQGQANIVCKQGDKQILFRQLGPGDIAGEDTFFGISICTTSVVCQSQVVVKYLERKSMQAWQEALPGLEGKLRAFCQSHYSLDHSQAAKKVERRLETRYSLEVALNAQLQNLQGQDIGASFRGVLDDISAHGACFYVKISQQANARMLLGRPVRLTFSLGKAGLDLRGVIVSSKHHLGNDYSVHVKLVNTDDALLHQLLDKLYLRQQGAVNA